jgi:hypothetical protein
LHRNTGRKSVFAPQLSDEHPLASVGLDRRKNSGFFVMRA